MADPDHVQRCSCDNCSWRGSTEETKPVRDFWQRVDPGGEVPVGECPQCGALAYLGDEPEDDKDDLNDYQEDLP
jgi:hypothetical protein